MFTSLRSKSNINNLLNITICFTFIVNYVVKDCNNKNDIANTLVSIINDYPWTFDFNSQQPPLLPLPFLLSALLSPSSNKLIMKLAFDIKHTEKLFFFAFGFCTY